MAQAKSKTSDFTTGRIIPQLIVFALPILLGQVFQTLYNSVDSIVVGRYVGTTALAAVAASSDISYMLVGFFTGLSSGAGVLFSRYFGARDYDKLHDAIHTAMAFSVIFGLVIAGLGLVITPWLLKVVACPDDVYPEAIRYLRIYISGAVLTSIYNVASGALRAVGDSRDPLIFLIVSSLVNIALDLLFVLGFGMGVEGVAIATVLAQLVSVVMVLWTMMRTDDVYQLQLKDLRIDKALLLKILDLGLPAGIQVCLICISNLFMQRFINLLGSAAMAGMGAAKKVDKFINIISNSVALSATTMVSQNVGANNYRRAFKGLRSAFMIAMVAVAALAIPLYYSAETALSLFTEDAAALAYGVSMMHVMVPTYYLQMSNSILSNVVRGFGKSRTVMVLSLLSLVGMRQLFLHIAMAIRPCAEVVYLSFPVGWLFGASFMFLYFLFAILRPYYRTKRAAEGL